MKKFSNIIAIAVMAILPSLALATGGNEGGNWGGGHDNPSYGGGDNTADAGAVASNTTKVGVDQAQTTKVGVDVGVKTQTDVRNDNTAYGGTGGSVNLERGAVSGGNATGGIVNIEKGAVSGGAASATGGALNVERGAISANPTATGGIVNIEKGAVSGGNVGNVSSTSKGGEGGKGGNGGNSAATGGSQEQKATSKVVGSGNSENKVVAKSGSNSGQGNGNTLSIKEGDSTYKEATRAPSPVFMPPVQCGDISGGGGLQGLKFGINIGIASSRDRCWLTIEFNQCINHTIAIAHAFPALHKSMGEAAVRCFAESPAVQDVAKRIGVSPKELGDTYLADYEKEAGLAVENAQLKQELAVANEKADRAAALIAVPAVQPTVAQPAAPPALEAAPAAKPAPVAKHKAAKAKCKCDKPKK
jgi:hypothetical protein